MAKEKKTTAVVKKLKLKKVVKVQEPYTYLVDAELIVKTKEQPPQERLPQEINIETDTQPEQYHWWKWFRSIW
jgi:hypothetical protein